MSLRRDLVRLARAHPETQRYIVPILKGSKKAGAPKETFQIIGDWLTMETEEDSYEEGMIGNGETHVHKGNFGSFKDVRSLLRDVAGETGCSSDPKDWWADSDNEGRIETNWMVDQNNHEATPADEAAFKDGRKRLWLAQVTVLIHFARVWTPDADDIKKTLKLRIE